MSRYDVTGVQNSSGRNWLKQLLVRPDVRRGLWLIGLVGFLAVFGDFVANDRPLACRIDGQVYFPVLRGYAVDFGISKWDANLVPENWKSKDYDWVIFPPVAWSAGSLDPYNMNAVGPFEPQRLDRPRFRHWLGTDEYGRDVAAGLISGSRIALAVGLLAMMLAGLIGLLLGAAAGYFGDHGLKVSLAGILIITCGLFVGLFGSINLLAVPVSVFGGTWLKWLSVIGYFAIWIGISWSLVYVVRWIGLRTLTVHIPVDLLVMRLVEVVQSIPVLLLILSLLALITRPSLIYIALIIGLVRWTTIARFVRGELLQVRQMDYMDAARASGLTHWRMLFRHALPNALTPVVITLAFGVASAILAEASLSFLGIGVPEDAVTWGGLLHSARSDASAWWLAVLPGIFIFLTVTGFNLIGEGLRSGLSES